jgi:acetyl esterase/lipase
VKRFIYGAILAGLGLATGLVPGSSAAEIEAKKTIAYRTDPDADATRHKLDILMPKNAKKVPVLFFVHGGAWTLGDKWTFSENAKGFAAQGIGVVAVNYRLSPKVKHPGHIEDVARAFRWTVDEIAQHGGDPKKIVLAGHSAGGHLVALLATEEKYLKAEKKSFADIRGVIGVSGVYQIDHRISAFHAPFGDKEAECKAASPIHNISKNHPPFLLLFGDKDIPLLDVQAKQFSEKLTAAKCEATAKEISGRDHIAVMFKATKEDDPVFAAMKAFIQTKTAQ